MSQKLTLFFLIGLTLSPLASSPPKHLMTSADWHLYHHKDFKGKDVYALIGYPHQKTGKHKTRKDTYILFTAKENFTTPIFLTFVAGDTLTQKGEVIFSFGKDEIKLVSQKDKALAPSNEADQKLIEHMKKYKTLKVTSHFKTGEKTQDTYQLSGFTKAYQKLKAMINNRRG